MTSSSSAPATPTTAAFHMQAVISFALAFSAVALAVIYLPTDPWVKAFLGLGMAYLVTSAFTLAKTIRDRQEITTVVSRVDQARIDKLLAEHDPFVVR